MLLTATLYCHDNKNLGFMEMLPKYLFPSLLTPTAYVKKLLQFRTCGPRRHSCCNLNVWSSFGVSDFHSRKFLTNIFPWQIKWSKCVCRSTWKSLNYLFRLSAHNLQVTGNIFHYLYVWNNFQREWRGAFDIIVINSVRNIIGFTWFCEHNHFSLLFWISSDVLQEANINSKMCFSKTSVEKIMKRRSSEERHRVSCDGLFW